MKRRMTTTMIALGLLLSIALWSVGRNVNAATLTVTNTLDDGSPGTLRSAIATASSGDTINFNLSGCPCTITLTSGALVINKNLTIQGPGANQLAVNGNNASRVFNIQFGSTVTLDGLTITGGNFFGNGGGIRNAGTLTVSNSTVSNNSASSNGGGIDNQGTLTLSNSTVSNNSTGGTGGGIRNSFTLIVSNSTVSNNSASGNGGGIFNGASTMTVSNSTITGNSANGGGGGGIFFLPGDTTVNNTIVAGNFAGATPNDLAGNPASASHNLIGDSPTSGGLVHGVNGNIVGNAGFGTIDITTVLDPTLAFNGGPTQTHQLVCGSPALDAGDNALAVDASGMPLTTDQRGAGFPRIFNTTVDIGAFEAQAPLVCNSAPVARCQSVTVSAGATCTATVTAAQVDNGSSDPDGDSISLALDSTGPFGLGNHTVTLTVTDSHGASSSCSATVTVVDNTAPTITLNGDNPLTVECHTGFFDPGATATDNCAGAVTLTASHNVNPNAPGMYTITYSASDAAGNLATATRLVKVVDTSAPSLTLKPAIQLWPPNHGYQTVTMSQMVASVSDGCATSLGLNDVVIEQVTSDEPDNAPGEGDGNTTGDILIASDCRSVQLRAERDETKNGRVYAITLRVRDAAGNETRAVFKVSVPIGQNGVAAVQDAPAQTQTSGCP